MRIIFSEGEYRIVEREDFDLRMDDLKGDTFNRKVNPEIPEERMAEEERHFEELVEREGVFGYVLERWCPQIDAGWEHVDSCWGFVGQYSPTDETFTHYIVNEMKGAIASYQGHQAIASERRAIASEQAHEESHALYAFTEED